MGGGEGGRSFGRGFGCFVGGALDLFFKVDALRFELAGEKMRVLETETLHFFSRDAVVFL